MRTASAFRAAIAASSRNDGKDCADRPRFTSRLGRAIHGCVIDHKIARLAEPLLRQFTSSTFLGHQRRQCGCLLPNNLLKKSRRDHIEFFFCGLACTYFPCRPPQNTGKGTVAHAVCDHAAGSGDVFHQDHQIRNRCLCDCSVGRRVVGVYLIALPERRVALTHRWSLSHTRASGAGGFVRLYGCFPRVGSGKSGDGTCTGTLGSGGPMGDNLCAWCMRAGQVTGVAHCGRCSPFVTRINWS